MTECNIIIPTYNRPAYLQRILSYYDSFGEGFRVIVADSSSDENKGFNKDIISSVSNLDIRYLDSYPTEINLLGKLTDTVNHTEGKYCVFCADDDFVTPNGIKQSIDFLEKNPDFVVAHGRYIGFRLEKSGGKTQKFRWGFADRPISIEFSDPESRLEYHLSNYFTTTMYGVHRSDVLKMVYKEAVKSEADPFIFDELLTSMLTLIYGKMKCLDILYAARSEQTVGIGWPSITLRSTIEAGTFDKKYTRFRDCLATHLSKESHLDIEESGKLVDKAMSAYLNKHLLKPVVPIPRSKKRTTLDSLPLPDWMYKGIVALYAALYKALFIKSVSLYNALIVKPMYPLAKNRDDFNRMRLHVLSHSGTVCGETVKPSISL